MVELMEALSNFTAIWSQRNLGGALKLNQVPFLQHGQAVMFGFSLQIQSPQAELAMCRYIRDTLSPGNLDMSIYSQELLLREHQEIFGSRYS